MKNKDIGSQGLLSHIYIKSNKYWGPENMQCRYAYVNMTEEGIKK